MKRLKYLNLFSSLIVLLLIYFNTNAQDVKTKTDSLSVSLQEANERISDLSEEVEFLNRMLDKQIGLIGQEQSALSNSMSSMNVLLVAISMVVGFLILRFQKIVKNIEKKEEKIEELKKDIDVKQQEINAIKSNVDKKQKEVVELEEKVSKARNSVIEIDERITSDIDGLYEKLRISESKVLLKRLADVPEDISNLFQLLAARKLHGEDFSRLLVAYRNLKKNNEEAEEIEGYFWGETLQQKYLLLFFQHFCGEAIAHELVREDLVKYFDFVLFCAYKKDVNESTKSLVLCLNEKINILDNEEILTKYLSALTQSKHKECQEPYRIILDTYADKAELRKVIEKLDSVSLVFAKLFKK